MIVPLLHDREGQALYLHRTSRRGRAEVQDPRSIVPAEVLGGTFSAPRRTLESSRVDVRTVHDVVQPTDAGRRFAHLLEGAAALNDDPVCLQYVVSTPVTITLVLLKSARPAAHDASLQREEIGQSSTSPVD